MSDKKHNIMSDDEYQFPKDEYLDSTTSHSDKAESEVDFTTPPKQPSLMERFPVLKNKKVWGIVALVFVILIGMQMMHRKSDNKVIMDKPAQAAVPESVRLSSEIESLRASQATNMGEVQQLKNQVAQLQSAVSGSAQANTQLSQSVIALTEQVKLLSKTVEQNTHDLTVRKASEKGPVAKPITYRIKAVIPGRAWLVSSTGQSTTVSVGDEINSYYGSVKLIDSDVGRVLTSSGKVIRYGQFDH